MIMGYEMYRNLSLTKKADEESRKEIKRLLVDPGSVLFSYSCLWVIAFLIEAVESVAFFVLCCLFIQVRTLWSVTRDTSCAMKLLISPNL